MSPVPHPHVETSIRELVFPLFCKITFSDSGQSLLHSLDTLTRSLLAFHTAVRAASSSVSQDKRVGVFTAAETMVMCCQVRADEREKRSTCRVTCEMM